jgi:hypothetical protein
VSNAIYNLKKLANRIEGGSHRTKTMVDCQARWIMLVTEERNEHKDKK